MLYFFFQAEDGIRDLVRSRGLGDVYKRQGNMLDISKLLSQILITASLMGVAFQYPIVMSLLTVSYTHLTLPTSDLV